MHGLARILGAVVLVVAPLSFTLDPTVAQSICVVPPTANPPGDFLTGGGFIIATATTTPPSTQPEARKNFGVGGGCKEGGNGHGLWGHLEYIDHGMGLNVHWTTITAYRIDSNDPQARFICGTARTNLYGDVNFAVRAADHASSGGADQFDIQLTTPAGPGGVIPVYSTGVFGGVLLTPHPLAGGNITIHKPNPSTMGSISDSCPAIFTTVLIE